MKKCTKCATEKPLIDFYTRGDGRVRSACKVCERKRAAAARAANPEPTRQYARKHYANKRARVIAHYGGRCVCCGEDEPAFLAVDHIEGGGTKHRTTLRTSDFTRWVVQNNFPDYLQLLCHNCNWATAFGRTCPHEQPT